MAGIVDILIVLDRSGSMEHGRVDHEGGLRSFVRDQQDLEGDVRLTFCQFDGTDQCEVVVDRKPIADVKAADINLIPRGSTPLYAGVGRALAHLAAAQAKEPADQTIAMVVTDGGDTGGNGEWTRELVRARTKDLEANGWAFIYLGANQDAFEEAGHLGVSAATAANYVATPQSIAATYAFTSSNVATARRMRSAGNTLSASATALNYTGLQRASMSGSGGAGGQDPFTGSVAQQTSTEGGGAGANSVVQTDDKEQA